MKIIFVIVFVSGIGGMLFADQIAAVFRGLSPLESLRLIWTFVLHVTVTSVIGYAVVGASKVIQPWVRTMRKRRKALRRAPRVVGTAPRAPKVNKDQVLMWMASQLQGRKRQDAPNQPSAGHESPTVLFK
jgi:hypothetical protein